MGIQRFGAHLKPYAVKCVLGSTDSPAQNTVAIIDGPGLAHHVYYKLCAKRDRSTENITYSDIVSGTVTWLDSLSSSGYPAKAILFDGALPESKKGVRIGRLQSYLGRLQAYKQSVGSGSPSPSGQARRSLPPPPFLVFAVVEELLQHEKYAEITYVVPGEADGFCVAAAKSIAEQTPDETIAVFSDDADLLVYEFTAKTCIVPFRDLFESRTATGVTWSGELYWSAMIVKQLPETLQDLIKPAFYMAQDYHCDLKQACRKTIASDPASRPEFAAFARTYQPTADFAEWNRITSDTLMKSLLVARDSRVSELIYQLSEPADGLRMYLPFLFEDIARATAWNIGADIRTFAYSALFQAFKSDAGVQEYRRSGMRLASTLLDGLPGAMLDERLDELVTHIKQVRVWAAEALQLSTDDAWRYLAMQHTLQYLHTEGYPLPSVDDMVHVITTRPHHKWHLIHLSAQYQAMYYSFRVLRQVLAHISSMFTGRPEADATSRLHDQLASLPRIADFFANLACDRSCPREEYRWERWREQCTEILAQFGGEEQYQTHGKKRKKRRMKAKQAAPSKSVFATNAFAMLTES